MNQEDITILSLLAREVLGSTHKHLYYFWERAALYETELQNVDIHERLKALIEGGYVEIAVERGYDSLYQITEAGRAALPKDKA